MDIKSFRNTPLFHIAEYSDSIFRIFNKERSTNLDNDLAILENHLKTGSRYHNGNLDNLSIVTLYSRIVSFSLYYRWKRVTDFRLTPLEMVSESIIPFNERVLGYIGHSSKKSCCSRDMVFIPSRNPFALDGNANSLSERSFIDSFFEAEITSRYSLTVILLKGTIAEVNFDKIDQTAYGTKVKFIRMTLNEAISFINTGSFSRIFFDYFVYPFNLIPILVKAGLVCYISWGFTPAIFIGVDEIICGFSEKGIFDACYQRYGFLGQQKHVKRCETLSGTKSLERRLQDGDEIRRVLLALRRDNSPIFGTLCRGSKLSEEFLHTAQRLAESTNGIVLIAGIGVKRSLSSFERVIGFDSLPPWELLTAIDVYLETFPEFQGYAAVEAIKVGVPVVTLLRNGEYSPTIHERYPNNIASDLSGYVELATVLATKPGFAINRSREQNSYIKSAIIGPDEYWRSILFC
jgi:hypothetical protein